MKIINLVLVADLLVEVYAWDTASTLYLGHVADIPKRFFNLEVVRMTINENRLAIGVMLP